MLYLQVPHSLRSARPATGAIVLRRHCRKHKQQTQTQTLMWRKQKGERQTAKTGKQKLGQKQLRSQISGSVSAGALRSRGSQAGSRGGSLFCSQTTNTPPLAGFFSLSLSLASPQFEDADQD